MWLHLDGHLDEYLRTAKWEWRQAPKKALHALKQWQGTENSGSNKESFTVKGILSALSIQPSYKPGVTNKEPSNLVPALVDAFGVNKRLEMSLGSFAPL